MVKGSPQLIIPRSRCQEEVIFQDGRRGVRCYSKSNPHYFKTASGQLYPINMDEHIEGVSKGKASKKRSSNTTSVGVRADGNIEKICGLRPDFSQETGEHQLEFTLVQVTVDGVDQDILSKIKSPKASHKDAKAWDMGQFQVIPNRRFCRQAVLINRPTTSFRIEFLVHVKGLTITPAEGRSCWHVRDASGEVDWLVTEPLLLDENLEEIQINDSADIPIELISHSMKENPDGSFTYIKESVDGADYSVLPEQFLVDASIAYSSTNDIEIYNGSPMWSIVWGAPSGNLRSVGNTFASFGSQYIVDTHNIYRVFMPFDTSALWGTVVSASLFLKGITYNASGAYIYAGSQQDPVVSGDFDAFSGNLIGSAGTWLLNVFNEIQLNAEGLDAINLGGLTKFCCRGVKDHLNEPSASVYFSNLVTADNAGTESDPYLYLELRWNPNIMMY